MRLLRRKEGCMILMRRRYMGKVNGIIPASSYIQDGLIAMYDGIENAGAGQHSNSATTWKDLSGNGWDLTLGGNNTANKWETDHFNFVSFSNTIGQRFTLDATNMGSIKTLEFCMENAGEAVLLHYRDDFGFVVDGRNGGYAYKWLNNSSTARAFPFGKNSGSIDIDNNIMYRNNVLCSAQSNGRTTVSTNSELIIGCKLYNGYRGHTSFKLFNLRFYNRILTDEERALNYAIDQLRFNLT